jgi:hypothetical protein
MPHLTASRRPVVTRCRRLFAAAGWLFAVGCGTLDGALEVESYDPARHDRFYVGADRAFFGDDIDLSGVGRSNSPARYATLIAPDIVVFASHFTPANGTVFRFYHTNDPAGPFEERTLVTTEVIAHSRFFDSDLSVGWLDAPVSEAVTAYPVALFGSDADYEGAQLYVFGQSNTSPQWTNQRAGRAVVDRFADGVLFTLGAEGNEVTLRSDTIVFKFSAELTTDLIGGDSAQLQVGDSGGPSFVLVGGKPALIGVNTAVDTSGTPRENFVTALSRYLGELQSITGNAVTTAGQSAPVNLEIDVSDDGTRTIAWPQTSTDAYGVFRADSLSTPRDGWVQISPDINLAPNPLHPGAFLRFEDTDPLEDAQFYQVRTLPFANDAPQ